jgi:hypothetical protein
MAIYEIYQGSLGILASLTYHYHQRYVCTRIGAQSFSNELLVLASLADESDRRLQQFATTIDDDQSLLCTYATALSLILILPVVALVQWHCCLIVCMCLCICGVNSNNDIP